MLTSNPRLAEADQLLARAAEIIDQEWRVASTRRAVFGLVDAYFSIREARSDLARALSPNPFAERPSRHRKLTDAQVREIRSRWEAGGVTQAELAEEYGVHRKYVQHIVHGRARENVA